MKKLKVTLVELIIVVALMAILLAMFSGNMFGMSDMEKIRKTAQQLEAIELGVRMYKLNAGDLPQNAGREKNPDEEGARVKLSDYILDMDFEVPPPIGGGWKYHTSGNEGNAQGMTVYIQLFQPDLDNEQLELLDSLVDDGNLKTGKFTYTGNHFDFIVHDPSK